MIINRGLAECKLFLGKQKSSDMFYFYEGSIDGFEECRNFTKMSQYENRLEELNQEALTEISCSCDDEELRQQCGIYDSERKMDINEVWKIKGRRTQVDYVYQRLQAMRFLLTPK